jgi:hypothetical protein
MRFLPSGKKCVLVISLALFMVIGALITVNKRSIMYFFAVPKKLPTTFFFAAFLLMENNFREIPLKIKCAIKFASLAVDVKTLDH